MEFSAASEHLDICDLGIPKHVLRTLKMMNLAEENLNKWSLYENDKGILLKLFWNKSGRSKSLKSRKPRPKLSCSEDPTHGRDSDSFSSGEGYLLVPTKLIKIETKES